MILRLADASRVIFLNRGGTRYLLEGTVPRPAGTGDLSVTNTFEVFFDGGTPQGPREIGNYVTRLLEQAARRWGNNRKVPQNPHVDPVYIEYALRDGEPLYRSEIFDGRVVWEGRTGNAEWLRRDHGQAAIIVEHRPWWEGPEEELPLTNGNGALVKGGLAVWNHNDSDVGHDNYVQVDAYSTTGDLPAPVRVEMENTTASTTMADVGVYIGHSYDVDAMTTHYDASGALAADALYNGNDYASYSISNSTFTAFFGSAVSAATNVAGQGAPFVVAARLTNVTAPIWLYAEFIDGAGEVLWRGAPVRVASGPPDEGVRLGLLRLPPLIARLSVAFAGSLQLCGRHEGAAATIHLDYVALFPTASYLSAKGAAGVPAGDYLVLDSIENDCYRRFAATGGGRPVRARGGPLEILPNRDNRLYFFWQNTARDAPASDSAAARVYYRPRRRSL